MSEDYRNDLVNVTMPRWMLRLVGKWMAMRWAQEAPLHDLPRYQQTLREAEQMRWVTSTFMHNPAAEGCWCGRAFSDPCSDGCEILWQELENGRGGREEA